MIYELLHEVYAFDHCEVLFKPTLAIDNQFRSTKKEFISYFLGQNKICKEDKGFAIKNWESIKFENYKIIQTIIFCYPWVIIFKDGSAKFLRLNILLASLKLVKVS